MLLGLRGFRLAHGLIFIGIFNYFVLLHHSGLRGRKALCVVRSHLQVDDVIEFQVLLELQNWALFRSGFIVVAGALVLLHLGAGHNALGGLGQFVGVLFFFLLLFLQARRRSSERVNFRVVRVGIRHGVID